MRPGVRLPGLEIDMASRRLSLFSTIASKFLIALTGLSLVGFLCIHLIGNLLLYFGPAKFNAYSHALITNPFVIPAEIGLAAIFILHMLEAGMMWFSDRAARPIAYQHAQPAGGSSRKSLASSTMIWTGSTMLIFLIIHIGTMKYGVSYPTLVHGEPGRDLSRLVVEVFQNPLWVTFYAVCMVAVGFHVWHAFSSAFESLGLNHPNLTPKVLKAGKLLSLVLGTGFFSIPIWMFFIGGRS